MSRVRASLQSAVVAALLTALPAMAAAQVRSFAFVANYSDDSVSVIDSSTHTVIATITGIERPRGIAVTPDGRFALVVSQVAPSAVVTIDVATLSVVGTPIELSDSVASESIVITPDGLHGYVNDVGSSKISVIDISNGWWLGDITSVASPTFLALSPDGHDLYVASSSPNRVTRIDTATSGVVGTPVALPAAGRGIAISPDGALGYVAADNGILYEIDLSTQALTGVEFTVNGNPYAVAFAPNANRVLVANMGYVSVIDPAGIGFAGNITTGGNFAAAISPDGRWAYALNSNVDTVDVIDMDTLTLAGPAVAVGDSPYGAGSNFVSPAMIAGMDALDITQDSDLADAGFRDHVTMRAGTLRLGGNLSTTRTFSILTTSTINTQAHTATLPGIIGPGMLIKTGSGTLLVSGSASHGGTMVAAGTLMVTGSHHASISTSAGALVRGNGAAGSVTIDSGATLRPGFGGPGTLTAGTVQFGSNSTLTIDIAGATMGSGYSRVSSFDAIIGASVTLDVQLDALYTPPPGTEFVIVANRSSGTFAGLAEGARFMAGSTPLRISYAGGDGNDVVLTVEEPPSVTTLSDDATGEDQAYSVPFTIGDSYTTVGALTVSATSVDNQTLVPNVNLQVTGTGASRTLVVTPAANASGTAQIRVDVSDGFLATQRTFNLTVNPVDDAPTITAIGPQTIAEDTVLAPVAFTVDDIDTDVAALQVTATSSDQTLVTDADLISGGSGGTRTIAATPAQHAFGTATITVRVSDGSSYDERQFLLTVTSVNDAPTITPIAPQTIGIGGSFAVSTFTVADRDDDPAGLTVTASSASQTLFPDANLALGGSGGARTIAVTPAEGATGSAAITVTVSDGHASETAVFMLTVTPTQAITYTLAEGATGSFFNTDLAIANPHAHQVPVSITFLKDDGTSIVRSRNLMPTSRTTIEVDEEEGLEAAAFSIEVTSTTGVPIGVERTMRWDATGYGASTEKASRGASETWYFAEGSQGWFSTFLLLANPHETANVAHVTWLREGEAPLVRDYALEPRSRRTVDAFSESELRDRAFGAKVTFDQPGFAERSMYFGGTPIWLGGHAAAGATAPGTSWFLAEGATGSFFTTFVLIANPGDQPAEITLTYYPEFGSPVTRTDVVGPGQRMTRNIAIEDLSLASAAVATRVTSTQPVIVERSQYWGSPVWVESHNSVGVQHEGREWLLAEGVVGGASGAQTYILLANTGTQDATVTLTFLRTSGETELTEVNVPAESRVTVGVTGAVDGLVPELTDESFGTLIRSTQPIIVERSIYMNSNGVIWAAGTNATAQALTTP